ncbi:MAG: VWA domain-containing protein [Candidatus Thermoplasmatota archaeon]|nr:VWA domain-containing protein [Candidatus Thermoplasmatota archaeon]
MLEKKKVLIWSLVVFVVICLIATSNSKALEVSKTSYEANPHFDISVEGDTDRIWPLQEDKKPDEIEVNLSFSATGPKALKFDPQDTMLVVDFSQQSMSWDPNFKRIEATKAYVDNMVPPDRAGVVRLVTDPTVEHELSQDYESVKDSLEMVHEPGGRTNYEDAIYKATDELIEDGDPEKQRFQIFLSNGDPTNNVTEETMNRVRENNISIYTIGMGDDVNDSLLGWMANTTGGKYHYVEDPAELKETYLNISNQFYTNKTGRGIELKTEFRDYIHLHDSTLSRPPDNISKEGDLTEVDWELNYTMRLGDSWGVKFNISTTKRGTQPVFTENSGLYYVRPWDNKTNFTSLPDYTIYGIIQATAPPPPPPPPPAAAPPPPPPEIFPMPSPPVSTVSVIPQASLQPVAQSAGYQALFAPFVGLGVGEALKGKSKVEAKEGVGMRAGKKSKEDEEEEEKGSSLGYTLNER